MACGLINLSPGTFWVACWWPGFDLACLKNTTQVWIQIYGLPLEFRGEQNLLNIAVAVGLPLKIDHATINKFQGLYSRVLVDIDISKRLSERIFASLKNDKKDTNLNFFVTITYEKLPRFYRVYKALGRDENYCAKKIAAPHIVGRREDGIQTWREGDMR